MKKLAVGDSVQRRFFVKRAKVVVGLGTRPQLKWPFGSFCLGSVRPRHGEREIDDWARETGNCDNTFAWTLRRRRAVLCCMIPAYIS